MSIFLDIIYYILGELVRHFHLLFQKEESPSFVGDVVLVAAIMIIVTNM